MRIVSMTATFGCLDEKTLTLSKGVNLLSMPNEAGKSTWADFLTVMFYGLDTRRTTKDRLSHRERYEPWNGKAMEGRLELELKGRRIILQRTSVRGKPMSVFKAWDQQTGLEITSLTAENCGRQLLGVEREVFRRTAFLSGTQLCVTPDQELSRRLGSLAASGSEKDSYLQAEQRLRNWQNRLRYHQSGEIPKCMQALAQMEWTRTRDNTAHLPSRESLLRMLGRLDDLSREAEPCPAALEHVPPEQILPTVQKHLVRHMAVTVCVMALAILCLALGIVVQPWCFLPCVIFAAFGLWWLFGRQMLRTYGVKRRKDILPAALRWSEGKKRRWELAVLLEEVRDFAPQAETVQEARIALEDALAQYQQAAEPYDFAKAQRLQKTLEELLTKERAIVLARQALEDANRQLQQTYVPKLTSLASGYLKKLTTGRYDGLVMNEKMELSVKETAGFLRPLAAVSSGTQDQTWLALRLAMTKLLLPEDMPVVLDDALLTFDEEREQAALSLLEEENRQVLVFSCK